MTSSLRLARVLCLALSLALPLSFASAADSKHSKQLTPTPAPSVNLRIDVLMVAMPQDKFIALLPDLSDKDKIEKTIPDLLDAINKKEMILEGYQVVVTKSGQRAIAESVKEIRYPTEYGSPDATPAPAPQSDQPAPTPAAAPAAAYTPGEPVAPTAFETRNVGVTLEVEPTVSGDGQSIDMDIAAQHVQLLGFLNTAGPNNKEGGGLVTDLSKPITAMPLIYTVKDIVNITLRNGRHVLLGVHQMAQPEGYIEIFIVHAEILPDDK